MGLTVTARGAWIGWESGEGFGGLVIALGKAGIALRKMRRRGGLV